MHSDVGDREGHQRGAGVDQCLADGPSLITRPEDFVACWAVGEAILLDEVRADDHLFSEIADDVDRMRDILV